LVEATSATYARDLILLRLMPHMHLRGRSFKYEAVYPDGKKETLLDVPRYDFNWQTTYRLKESIPFPKGTAMHCVAHFDNSENNPNNPDPTKTVEWGDQTWEEMMIGFFEVAFPIDTATLEPGSTLDLKPTMESTAKRIIEGFDKDKDGKVSREEVPARGQVFFARMDLNKDGFITVDEAAKVIEEQQNQQKERRERRERNVDGEEKKD